MAYADGLLSKGERITHREKQHWWVFVWGARFTILAVVIAVILFILGGNLSLEGSSGTFRSILSWITAALFIGGLALLLWTTLRYISQEYVLTNRRVLQVEGVVNKRVVDSSLEKINDAVLEQSIFGRALGFGDLKVLTASEAAISEFKMIRNPIQFKKAMLDAKYEYERDVAGTGDVVSPPLRQPAPQVAPLRPVDEVAPVADPARDTTDDTVSAATPGTPAPAPLTPDEVTRTLTSLAELRDRGAITSEEFERKKADLLSRL
ncbi:MAG TPA: PH domain-containing protein [Candidatus Saccharimonadales bacterium]|nr:PH domain-containing protein [Candidatus Saccharimonadales bacterium]